MAILRTKGRIQFNWEAFGERIRAELKERKIRQIKIAEELCIWSTVISRAAKGYPVSADTMIGLCDWLGINPLDFAVDTFERKE